MSNIPLHYDGDNYHPIPSLFRQTIEDVVEAFQSRRVIERLNAIDDFIYLEEAVDYSLSQIKKYPASKIYIGPETWARSFCLWKYGYWDLDVILYADDSPPFPELRLHVKPQHNATSYEYYFRYIVVNR